MNDTIVVIKVANGFMAQPQPSQHACIGNESVYVFETYEGLFGHIKKQFDLVKPEENN